MKTTVTRTAVKELISELLDDVTSGAAFSKIIKPNDVVDSQASETDPMHDNKPQNKVELGVAVKQLTKDLPDTEAQRVYDQLSTILNDKNNKKMTSSEKQTATQLENAIRKQVRSILKEEWEAYDAAVANDDDEEIQQKKQKQKVDDDQSFIELAKELGMSIAGAKQFVDKALARWKFLSTQRSSALKSKTSGGEDVTTFEPEGNLEDLDVLILKAWSDYIDLLNSSGELTPADVQLMHDHPEVALDLDGFREFLSEYIMGTINPIDAEGDSWLGKFPGDVDPQLNKDKPEGKRSGVRTFQNAPGYEGDYDWLEPDDEDGEEEAEKIRRKAGKRAVKSAAQG